MPKFKKNPNPIHQNFGVGTTENPDATSPSSSGFKLKYKHNSAFPFKSPVKLTQQFTPTPAAGPYGRWAREQENAWEESNRRLRGGGGVPPHTHDEGGTTSTEEQL
mgnify:CR=1 FL=1